MNKYVKSPLNYTGGKYKLLSQIFPLFPVIGENTFVDLFCDGFNVGINVEANKIIANDNIDYLIELYKWFQSNTEQQIIEQIQDVIIKYSLSKLNQDGYNNLRVDYNKNKSPLKLLCLLFYSFNHQIRFNNNHEFNCSFGKNRSSYNSTIEKNLINFIKTIHSKNIDFQCGDFTLFKYEKLNKGDFVYCDPSYLITTACYNDGNRGFKNWTKVEQQQLFDILDELDKRGVQFAMSNVLEDGIKKDNMLAYWSKKYNIHHLKHSYENSNYHKKERNNTDEVLVTNY